MNLLNKKLGVALILALASTGAQALSMSQNGFFNVSNDDLFFADTGGNLNVVDTVSLGDASFIKFDASQGMLTSVVVELNNFEYSGDLFSFAGNGETVSADLQGGLILYNQVGSSFLGEETIDLALFCAGSVEGCQDTGIMNFSPSFILTDPNDLALFTGGPGELLSNILLDLVIGVDSVVSTSVEDFEIFAEAFLQSDATLTYEYEVTAVPLPAAVWLFGAGFFGLVGVSRKRKLALEA